MTLARHQARALAEWCVWTGLGPDVFYRLTLLERHAFMRAANKLRG